MDINLSGEESFAFSDIVPPSHVSGLESFSDFDDSDFDQESLVENDENSTSSNNKQESREKSCEDENPASESFSFSSVPSADIKEFWAAIASAKEQLGMPMDNTSVALDESSLGLLPTELLEEVSCFGDSQTSLSDLRRKDSPSSPSLQSNNSETDNQQGNELSYSSGYQDALSLSHIKADKNLEERPDTSQPPDTFFNPQDSRTLSRPDSANEDVAGHSQSQDDFHFMLQTRAGSGDGGELIDRMSLASSISFLQSQTFPDSIFSQSLSSTSRGLGSGMDSRSGSDIEQEDELDITPSNQVEDQQRPDSHDVGDGRHSGMAVGRPGLEGANSDTEDVPAQGRPSSDFGSPVAESIGDDQPSSQRSSVNSSPGEGADTNPPSSSSGERLRGLPVGHAASDTPNSVLSPSPSNTGDMSTSSSLDNFDVLTASTPMVRNAQVAFDFDATPVNRDHSGLGLQYLLPTHNDTVRGNVFQDSSLHLSQTLVAMTPARGSDGSPLQNEQSNTITDHASSGFASSNPSTLSTKNPFDTSDTDNSLLWKSTPREENESLSRTTPGILFKGSTRPSSVTDDNSNQNHRRSGSSSPSKNVAIVRPEVQKTAAGSSKISSFTKKYGTSSRSSNSRPSLQETHKAPKSRSSVDDSTSGRTMTPGGSGEQVVPFSFQGPDMSQQYDDRFLSGVGFGEEPCQQSINNPFDSEGGIDEWGDVGRDIGDEFEAQSGDIEAMLAADEESFVREHQFDHAEADSTAQGIQDAHDWTIPDHSHLTARGSLLRVMGINDPNGTGEVRISFGAVMTAGSEELGTLHNDDPQRPRPHFGNGRLISTPSPQPPPKLISTQSLEQQSSFLEKFPKFENTPMKQTNVQLYKGSSAMFQENSMIPTVKKKPKNPRNRQGSIHKTSSTDKTFADQKAKLDKQYRNKVPRERRGSQSSSQSSSSKSSVPSVIDNSLRGASTKKRRSSNVSSSSRTRQQQQGKHVVPSDSQRSEVRSRSHQESSSRPPTSSFNQSKVHGSHKTYPRRQQRSGSDGNAHHTEGTDSRRVLRGKGAGSAPDLPGHDLEKSGVSDRQDLAAFIAAATNTDADYISKILAEAAKAKSRSQSDDSRSKASSHGDAIQESPEPERLSSITPIASSSPHNHSQPSPSFTLDATAANETSVFESSNEQLPNLDNTASNGIDASAFVKDSPENVSVIERDTLSVSPPKNVSILVQHHSPLPESQLRHSWPKTSETPQKTENDRVIPRRTSGSHGPSLATPKSDNEPNYMQAVVVSVAQNIPSPVYQGISPLGFPTHPQPQSAPFVNTNPLAYGAQPGYGQSLNGPPLGWTFPPPPIGFQHIPGPPTSLHAQQGPYHGSDTYGNFGSTAPTILGPNGIPIINYLGHAQNYAPFSGAQQMLVQPYTVSASVATRVSTMPQTMPPQTSSSVAHQGQVFQNTAPPSGLLQLGQPQERPGIDALGNQTVASAGASVVIPGEVKMPPVCCVGVETRSKLSLHNPSSRWIYCNVKVGSCVINGVQVITADDIPFTLPSKLIIDPHKTIDIEVLFTPKMAGLHLAKLHVTSTPLLPEGQKTSEAMTESLPILVSLEAVAEQPEVQILQEDRQVIDFGEMIAGTKQSRALRLINRGRAVVPVRLTITPNATSLHCFSFANADSSPKKDKGHTSSAGMLSIHKLLLDGKTCAVEMLSCNSIHKLLLDGKACAVEMLSCNSIHKLLLDGKTCAVEMLSCNSIHKLLLDGKTCAVEMLSCNSIHKLLLDGKTCAVEMLSCNSIHKLLLDGKTCADGSIEPSITWILFQAPERGELGTALGLPDEFIARVDIEIAGENSPIIGSVLLKATVGVARLTIPRSAQELQFTGTAGQSVKRTYALKNMGNINSQVHLKVAEEKYYTVNPTRTMLRPMQEVQITVVFRAPKSQGVVDSTLSMTVLPHGPDYEIPLRGMVAQPPAPIDEHMNLLLCNKSVVCWPGIAVGKAAQQKVILKNNAETKTMKLQLSIQGHHSDFQLQNMFGKVDPKSLASIVNLGPREELPVHILFAPSTLGLVSSTLIIKSAVGRPEYVKSKVPLHGCGGTSNLTLVDTRKLSEGYITNIGEVRRVLSNLTLVDTRKLREGYITNIGEVSLGKKNVFKVTVKNTGARAAFVKAVCYTDISSKSVYPPSHFGITPNNFILHEHCSKQLEVSFLPLENDALKCQREVSTVANVVFYFGDEVIRSTFSKMICLAPPSPETVESTSCRSSWMRTGSLKENCYFILRILYEERESQQKVILKNNAETKTMKLQLSIQGHHSDFQVPLHGCGGTSNLTLVDTRKLSEGYITNIGEVRRVLSNLTLVDTRKLREGYITNIGEVSLGKKNVFKVTVKNTGARAAFVKAVCYTDVNYPSTPDWSKFFQSCVSRLRLELVGSPRAESLVDRGQAEANQSLDLVPILGPTENAPAGSLLNDARNVEAGSPEELSWAVTPEQMVLKPCKTLPEQAVGRFQIVNFSERPLRFEFSWPGHCLSITPEGGQVPPRSQVTVLMSPAANLSSRGIDLPWSGTVHVTCDGQQKPIRVQIREELVLENSPFQPGTSQLKPLDTGMATPFTSAPLPSSHLPPLVVKNKRVEFAETVVGGESATELVLESTVDSNVSWNLSSVAPVYVKGDASGDVYRATYSAFWFQKRSGMLQGKNLLKILVKFLPMDPGQYSQHWDLKFQHEGFKRLHKQRIEVFAQAIVRDAPFTKITREGGKENQPAITHKRLPAKVEHLSHQKGQSQEKQSVILNGTSKISEKSTNRPRRNRGVYVNESEVIFPKTAVGGTSESIVKICNTTDAEVTVPIQRPQAPFSLPSHIPGRSRISAHRFVRIPVRFTPTEPGTSYTSVIVFVLPEQRIEVQVQGES
ncbi:predicted protein [Nematostella vectensis]|uniref:Centrosomal protein of 192 kDa n=1 Tax=Nematostella vectensis TaxID=45351 RepID=A7SP28_NEMVE|nr:predicted protein [Nematostella vectensis]|eukprot:XP_001626635.1 predicted protein [Nematostella vectensis]